MSKILTSIEAISKDIGFDIGNSNDRVQADLLNGFCEGLHNSMLQENDRQMQYCYIAKECTPLTLKVLTEIVEFIKQNAF